MHTHEPLGLGLRRRTSIVRQTSRSQYNCLYFSFWGSIDVPKFQSVKLTKCSNKKFFPRAFTVQLFIDFATKFVFGRTDTRTRHMVLIRHTPRVHVIIVPVPSDYYYIECRRNNSSELSTTVSDGFYFFK